MSIANLRVCASCEWIFKFSDNQSCPKCSFAHYGARFVYGNKCYRYARTQKPWFDKKILKYEGMLLREIQETRNEKRVLSK